jgi:hypothetical protein
MSILAGSEGMSPQTPGLAPKNANLHVHLVLLQGLDHALYHLTLLGIHHGAVLALVPALVRPSVTEDPVPGIAMTRPGPVPRRSARDLDAHGLFHGRDLPNTLVEGVAPPRQIVAGAGVGHGRLVLHPSRKLSTVCHRLHLYTALHWAANPV